MRVPRLFSDMTCMMLGFSLAVCAGLCASLASVSSKLAFEEGGSTISYFICTLLVEELCKPVNACVMIQCTFSLLLSVSDMQTHMHIHPPAPTQHTHTCAHPHTHTHLHMHNYAYVASSPGPA